MDGLRFQGMKLLQPVAPVSNPPEKNGNLTSALLVV